MFCVLNLGEDESRQLTPLVESVIDGDTSAFGKSSCRNSDEQTIGMQSSNSSPIRPGLIGAPKTNAAERLEFREHVLGISKSLDHD